MITQEQELTLFGGWAKVQIPPPIEIGASVLSESHLYFSYEAIKEPVKRIDASFTERRVRAQVERGNTKIPLWLVTDKAKNHDVVEIALLLDKVLMGKKP